MVRVLALGPQLRKLFMRWLGVLLGLVHAADGLVIGAVHIDHILEVREDILVELLYPAVAARKVGSVLLLSRSILPITIINLLLLLFLGITVADAKGGESGRAKLLGRVVGMVQRAFGWMKAWRAFFEQMQR